jgi:hypothetical protein
MLKTLLNSKITLLCIVASSNKTSNLAGTYTNNENTRNK